MGCNMSCYGFAHEMCADTGVSLTPSQLVIAHNVFKCSLVLRYFFQQKLFLMSQSSHDLIQEDVNRSVSARSSKAVLGQVDLWLNIYTLPSFTDPPWSSCWDVMSGSVNYTRPRTFHSGLQICLQKLCLYSVYPMSTRCIRCNEEKTHFQDG